MWHVRLVYPCALHSQGKSVSGEFAVVEYLNHYLVDWIDPPLTTISRCPDEVEMEGKRLVNVGNEF